MVRHWAKALSFDAPPDWAYATVARFSPAASPAPGSITVAREPLRAGDTLLTHASRALIRIAGAVHGFELLRGTERLVGGRRAVLQQFQFGAPGARVEQTVLLIDPADDPERNVTIMSCAAAVESAKDVTRVFEEMLGTVTFAAGAAPRRTGLEQVPGVPMPKPRP